MTTGGYYDIDASGGTDDQQVIRFERVGNTNVVELELEDAGPPSAIDFSFLIRPPQTLTLNGQDLSISDGNTVTLPATSGVDLCDAFGTPIN